MSGNLTDDCPGSTVLKSSKTTTLESRHPTDESSGGIANESPGNTAHELPGDTANELAGDTTNELLGKTANELPGDNACQLNPDSCESETNQHDVTAAEGDVHADVTAAEGDVHADVTATGDEVDATCDVDIERFLSSLPTHSTENESESDLQVSDNTVESCVNEQTETTCKTSKCTDTAADVNTDQDGLVDVRAGQMKLLTSSAVAVSVDNVDSPGTVTPSEATTSPGAVTSSVDATSSEALVASEDVTSSEAVALSETVTSSLPTVDDIHSLVK